VEDIGTYYGLDTQAGSPDYAYTVELVEWDAFTSETDSPDEPSLIVSLDAERLWTSIGVLLEEPGDVDYIVIDSTLDTVNLELDGNEVIDGSDMRPRFTLVDPSGEVVSDKGDVGPAGLALYPGAAAGEYLVEVSDVSGGGGPDHWAFLHLIARFETTSFDVGLEPDDTALQANPITLTEFENGSGKLFTQGLGRAELDATADEDWYALENSYDEGYVVVCLNSGLWGALSTPSLELYDEGGALLSSVVGDGDAVPNASLENVAVGPGTYYLRVVGAADTLGGPGDWYRFIAYVASFSVSSYAEGGYSCP
jgi:hypothetical protein